MIKTKINLQKELEINQDKSKAQADELLAEAGLGQVAGFLTEGTSRDREVLLSLGVNSINATMNEMQGKKIQLEKQEDYYGGRVFKLKEIKDLCMTYRLKFLPSFFFIGHMAIEVTASIREMEKNMTISRDKERAVRENITVEEFKAKADYKPFMFDQHELKSNFFIMAPPAMFNLSVKPKPEKIRQVRDWDPILFHKTIDGDFAMVRKWGDDFSIIRAIKGFFFRGPDAMGLISFLTLAAIMLLGVSMFTDLFIQAKTIYTVGIALAVLVVSFVLTGICLPNLKSDIYSENGWNTQFKK